MPLLSVSHGYSDLDAKHSQEDVFTTGRGYRPLGEARTTRVTNFHVCSQHHHFLVMDKMLQFWQGPLETVGLTDQKQAASVSSQYTATLNQSRYRNKRRSPASVSNDNCSLSTIITIVPVTRRKQSYLVLILQHHAA